MAMQKCMGVCGNYFTPNPRIKNHKYCDDTACQRLRKARWQKEKLSTDADYRSNQTDAQKRWVGKNPDYWRKYRAEHGDYSLRERQRCRRRRNTSVDKKNKSDGRKRPTAAKMDSLLPFVKTGTYTLRHVSDAAKMDTIRVQLTVIEADRSPQEMTRTFS